MQHAKKIPDHEVYNGLPDVLEASTKLHTLDKTTVLDTLCEVILKHQLEDIVGIRLLHNHNNIHAHELMLEQEENDKDGTRCLSTIAIPAQDAGGFAANSWMSFNNRYIPLEYSSDARVLEASDVMIREKDFFREFGQTLRALQVDDILGPCIADRSFYRNRPREESILVESTDPERRANIVQFDEWENHQPEKLIQTTWMAVNPEKIVNGCIINLCGLKCSITTYCGEDNSGFHVKKIGHDKSHIPASHTPDIGIG